MNRVAAAVGAYWLLALVCGFAFGTVRQFGLTPWAGPALATLIELPLILTALWVGCRWIVRRFDVPSGRPRWAMGALWFVCFLVTEFALGAWMRGWSAADTLAHFAAPEGALGLLGFVLAALFPVWAPQR